MSAYRIELISNQSALDRMIVLLNQSPVIGFDLETTEWWDKRREKIALIQLAFRLNGSVKIAAIDALAGLNLEVLRPVLESKQIIKAIHNAAFDATKMFRHYGFRVDHIHDTMIAARRSGERRYSLVAQSAIHLNLQLDKSSRQSDWSRRPLEIRQLDYAARDAYATLLLYEHQLARKLTGVYISKAVSGARQGTLLSDEMEVLPVFQSENTEVVIANEAAENELSKIESALLSVIRKLPDRFGPEQLSVSVGVDVRVGVAGWIIDGILGRETDIDEETARIAIGNLCEQKLVILTPARRLEAIKTATGPVLATSLESGQRDID